MPVKLVLTIPDDFYGRMTKQIPVVQPEFVKAFIFDAVNKALNNIESRKGKPKKNDESLDQQLERLR